MSTNPWTSIPVPRTYQEGIRELKALFEKVRGWPEGTLSVGAFLAIGSTYAVTEPHFAESLEGLLSGMHDLFRSLDEVHPELGIQAGGILDRVERLESSIRAMNTQLRETALLLASSYGKRAEIPRLPEGLAEEMETLAKLSGEGFTLRE